MTERFKKSTILYFIFCSVGIFSILVLAFTSKIGPVLAYPFTLSSIACFVTAGRYLGLRENKEQETNVRS